LETSLTAADQTWKRMEKLVKPDGPVRFIGVSNFSPTQMEELLAAATVRPAVHQFELHPYLPQASFVEWHRKARIPITGYAPLGNTSPYYAAAARESGAPPLLTHPVIAEVAAERKCSPAQVVLSWNMKRGVAVIPKAAQTVHIKENSKAMDCRLTDEDSTKINGISAKYLGRFNNPCKRIKMPCFQGLELPTQGV
jgi:diketogulonate reductase-like aldo/keto reductase